MNEWKELEIDNLPYGFGVVGKYIFASGSKEMHTISAYSDEPWTILRKQALNIDTYVYRSKSEPKTPTHEELAIEYSDDLYSIGFDFDDDACNVLYDWFRDISIKAFIAGRESADIPPEGNK